MIPFCSPRPRNLVLVPLLLVGLLPSLLPLVALGDEMNFPQPEFITPYDFPDTTVPEPTSDTKQWVDVGVLLAALSLASWLAVKRRSRRGLFWLMIFSLLYFGFLKQGCVCPIGSIQNVALSLFDSNYAVPITVTIFFVLPLLFALLFGRVFCASVCALGLGWRKTGVAAGIAAVFFRDVAGPYCVLALCAAIWQRRFKEAQLWLGGLAAYAAFFLWHWVQIDPLRSADAAAHTGGWVQFAGAAFVIATAQMNGFLLNLPQWVTAVYLPLALLGFASWQSRAGQFAGLSAVLFAVLFSFVGREFNQYWGSITAPLLCLGAARAPLALRDLWGRSAITNPFHHGLTGQPRGIAS